jgi:hypothetical protein
MVIKKIQEQYQPARAYMEAKDSLLNWLAHMEKLLKKEDFHITFLPILEEKLKGYKVSWPFWHMTIRIQKKKKKIYFIFLKKFFLQSDAT